MDQLKRSRRVNQFRASIRQFTEHDETALLPPRQQQIWKDLNTYRNK